MIKITYPEAYGGNEARYQCEECGGWERAGKNGGRIRHSGRCESQPQPTIVAPVVTAIPQADPARVYEVAGLQTHDRAEAHALAGRPDLVGSEKQIVWATEIRALLAPQIETRLARIEGRDADEAAYLRAFLSHTSAVLWINHQRYSADVIWSGRGVGTARKYGLPEGK
jgi:hypothetical protein